MPGAHDTTGEGMTLAQLTDLLDAYGAEPARWPAEKRAAALALVLRSPEARARRDAVARLDAVLDSAPSAEPSPELTARVLAAAQAPARRPGRRRRATPHSPLWRYAFAAVPVAAAAAIILFLTRATPPPDGQQMAYLVEDVGSYTTPMDALLSWPGIDLVDSEPSIGCDESTLGCPDMDLPPEWQPRSQSPTGRTHA